MSKSIPPLGALRAFEAASRHTSFVRAAEELNVTPAAISHQIKQLEHWVGAKLFERGARGVALSRAGQDYAQRVRDVFDRLIATSAAVRSNRSRRVVVIRAQLSLSISWLASRVTTFNQSQDDIDVQLLALPFDRNPSKGGVDIAIYQERPHIDGYSQELLIGGHYRVYAAPSLVSRGAPHAPALLLAQPLLHTTSVNATWRMPTLHDWFTQSGVTPPEVLPGMHFNLEYLTTIACMQGAGYALLHDELTLDKARAGGVVALPGPSIANPYPYMLVMKNIVKDEVRVVADWLLDRSKNL
jgi:LysR family transcriptional regulator, glycine cleavage system transcriptional activator